MTTDRGYVCPRHGEFTIGKCRWCEPAKEDHKAAAPRPPIVTEAAFTPTGLVPPPLKEHFVIATRWVGSVYGYLCQCGYDGKFPEMAAHLQFGNAAQAAPKDLP